MERDDPSLYETEDDIDLRIQDLQEEIRELKDRRKALTSDYRHSSIPPKKIQSQHTETMGRLASGVAHDLNNLLSPIISYAELAMEDLEEDEIMFHDLEQILEAARYARDITKQLLTISRSYETTKKLVCINKSLMQSRKMLRRLVREDIHIDFRLDPALGDISADPSQINQIILNLIINAQDAMPSGGKITIETSNVSLDGNYAKLNPNSKECEFVMLAVSDNGKGMNETTIRRIFDRFYTTKANTGTGLGLATVQTIVKRHDGLIKVFSEPAKGTSFKIFLPKADAAVRMQEEQDRNISYQGMGEYILVTEDEDSIRRLTGRILEKYGYNVIEAKDADESLHKLVTMGHEIDLLLTDIIMPGLNGQALYQKAASLRPDIKVLYMSGHENRIIEQAGVNLNGQAFLQKPFSVESLTRQVRLTIDKTS